MLRDEGLEESILLVEQITTIDKMVLCNRLCRVTSAKKKQEIEAAVKKQFAMQACMGREAQGWKGYDGDKKLEEKYKTGLDAVINYPSWSDLFCCVLLWTNVWNFDGF